MPELDKNLTLSAYKGTNTYLEVTASPPKYAPLDTNMTKQLCRTLGLYKVNGTLQGDSYSRYTYSSSLGSSTVKYFVTDLNPESLRTFTDSPLTPLSDHSKITVYLNRAILNHEVSKTKELHHIKKRYRWKQSRVETYPKNNEAAKNSNPFRQLPGQNVSL